MFDQLNVSFLNKSLTDSKHLDSSVGYCRYTLFCMLVSSLACLTFLNQLLQKANFG